MNRMPQLVGSVVSAAVSLCFTIQVQAGEPTGGRIVQSATLPPTSLALFPGAGTEADLEAASRHGLAFPDLPSIGSGLARAGSNEFWGITDRGPNFKVKGPDGKERRVFPLPDFAATLVRFRLTGDRLEPLEYVGLRDQNGRWVTGLSNLPGEEACYASPAAKSPLPASPNGVDIEGIRVLPDGRFLISEEYSPSLLVVARDGEVLMRYTPADKPLPEAAYPVKPILPAVFSNRRHNRGFECLALSADGKTAYVILQSPMGDPDDKRYRTTRVSRALRLDVSHPLEARVTGHFLMPLSAAAEYPDKQNQHALKLNDADWLAPDKLLVLEQGKSAARLLVADFSEATNLLDHPQAATLALEEAGTHLDRLPVRPASVQTWFMTGGEAAIPSSKLEGLAILNAREVALTNDNDFGVGENDSGDPSMLWIVRLPRPLPGLEE